MTEDEKAGLGVALNEAELLGFEMIPEKRVAAATFNVLTLPEEGPVPEDRRVSMVFRPVGRVAASLRNGRWDDPDAEVVPFEVEDLLEVVTSFGGLAIYGWEFIDVDPDASADWMDRVSLDWSSGDDGQSHSITVFQDATDRILQLRAWFDRIEIYDPLQQNLNLEAFIAGGKRWWDAFYAGDERATGFGMFPLSD